MTEAEAIEFLSDVAFVAFPSVRQWLLTTDKYNATIRMMAKALAEIGRDEADAVIDTWVCGKVTPPKYLRDTFTLEIRACALEQRRRKAEQQQREATPEPAQPRVSMRTIQTMQVWTDRWLPLAAMVRSGEMDQRDAIAKWHAILDEEWEKVRQPKGVTS